LFTRKQLSIYPKLSNSISTKKWKSKLKFRIMKLYYCCEYLLSHSFSDHSPYLFRIGFVHPFINCHFTICIDDFRFVNLPHVPPVCMHIHKLVNPFEIYSFWYLYHFVTLNFESCHRDQH
jgi:hypothetical protein